MKEIEKEFDYLQSYLYDPINPIQSKSWAWSEGNNILKRKIFNLEKMLQITKFVYDRFAYFLNIYLLVLTINQLFKFDILEKNLLTGYKGGVNFDISNETYVLSNYPENLVKYFDKFLFRKSPIVKLLFNNSDSDLEKLYDIERTFRKYVNK